MYSYIWIIYFFLFLMGLVFVFILVFSFYKRRVANKKKLWEENIADIISSAILFDKDGEAMFELDAGNKFLFSNKTFRQYFIDEIIHAKKNLTGAPIANLINLYETLSLDKDAQKKLKNKKWFTKAKGIHELAAMGQVKYIKEIFRLTNDPHELVRNEAQCALVNFYGFKGLRFLNVIIYPLSQWQQIQLLNYVHDLPAADLKHLLKWLKSKNNSVVTFTLRLASLCNCAEVYKEVVHCLENNDRQVKLSALDYLKKINNDDTSDQIIKGYAASDKGIQLHILSVLLETANDNQIDFLMKQLHNMDHTIKFVAAKILSRIHPEGPDFFHSILFSQEYPWNVIFNQIENEKAA